MIAGIVILAIVAAILVVVVQSLKWSRKTFEVVVQEIIEETLFYYPTVYKIRVIRNVQYVIISLYKAETRYIDMANNEETGRI